MKKLLRKIDRDPNRKKAKNETSSDDMCCISRIRFPSGWIVRYHGYDKTSNQDIFTMTIKTNGNNNTPVKLEDIKTVACLDEVYVTRLDCSTMLLEAA